MSTPTTIVPISDNTKIYIAIAIVTFIILGSLLLFWIGSMKLSLGPYLFFALTIVASLTLFMIYHFVPSILSIRDMTEIYISLLLFILVLGYMRAYLLTDRTNIEKLTFIPLFFYFMWIATTKVINNWLNSTKNGTIYSNI
jgi:hypothetical protein